MIVELNGDYHKTEPGRSGFMKVFMRTLLNLTLRASDAIKVLNADQEAFCRRLLPHKPIYRFPDFTASDYFESLQSHQGDYLLSVGHPFDLKGIDVLIAAFIRIADKHQQISLRIMGYCPQRDLAKYRAMAAGHPRIIFVEPGWIEDVGEQMRGCYALVNAARSEAMGRVHVEAMACAKPIIATRTNGALECVEDGQTGDLCAIGDIADLAAKLDKLLSNPSRAAQMGNAGKMRMHEIFSEAKCVEAYHTMFEEVIGRAPPFDGKKS
jgi:glycosyltransferase involved in cell wall biosynthesis